MHSVKGLYELESWIALWLASSGMDACLNIVGAKVIYREQICKYFQLQVYPMLKYACVFAAWFETINMWHCGKPDA